MSRPAWQLVDHHARLQLAQLSAAIDLGRPASGLFDVHLGADSPGATLLGIDIPSLAGRDAYWPAECYVRGSDLVVAYAGSEIGPVRVDALWRAAAPRARRGPLAIVGLVVSVWTDLLDSRPDLLVRSVVPIGEAFRLVDAQAGRFERIGSAGPHAIERGRGCGCLVFRLPDSDLSYAEMVHPADFVEDRLDHGSDPAPAVHLRHRLFSLPLEKGVLLRARVRGVFLARQDDTQVAAECYAAFAGEEPPLGT